jgi:D-amino peptidase
MSMDVFVMVDMEGISGICCTRQSHTTEVEYPAARRHQAGDVNACVEGCLAGGAKRIVVRDAHARGFNFPLDQLDPRAEYVQGTSSRQRMPDIAKFDGLILIGYHAMAGTPQAVIDHTWSYGWQNFHINGKKSGEIALEAGIAGDNGVPIIMVSGDDKTCREARRLLRDVVTVQVKKGLDAEGAQLLSKDRAHQLIRDGAELACRQYKRFQPYKFTKPVTMRLEMTTRGRIPNRPDVKVIDGRTYEVTARTVEQALRLL